MGHVGHACDRAHGRAREGKRKIRGRIITNLRTSYNENVALEFIRNQNYKEDNWYILDQPKNTHHWYTDAS